MYVALWIYSFRRLLSLVTMMGAAIFNIPHRSHRTVCTNILTQTTHFQIQTRIRNTYARAFTLIQTSQAIMSVYTCNNRKNRSNISTCMQRVNGAMRQIYHMIHSTFVFTKTTVVRTELK